MDGTHILVTAAGQLGCRGVHQGAEAPEQEQGEIGARAGHGRRLWQRLDNDNQVDYYLDNKVVELGRSRWTPHKLGSRRGSRTTTQRSTEPRCTTSGRGPADLRSCWST